MNKVKRIKEFVRNSTAHHDKADVRLEAQDDGTLVIKITLMNGSTLKEEKVINQTSATKVFRIG